MDDLIPTDRSEVEQSSKVLRKDLMNNPPQFTTNTMAEVEQTNHMPVVFFRKCGVEAKADLRKQEPTPPPASDFNPDFTSSQDEGRRRIKRTKENAAVTASSAFSVTRPSTQVKMQVAKSHSRKLLEKVRNGATSKSQGSASMPTASCSDRTVVDLTPIERSEWGHSSKVLRQVEIKVNIPVTRIQRIKLVAEVQDLAQLKSQASASTLDYTAKLAYGFPALHLILEKFAFRLKFFLPENELQELTSDEAHFRALGEVLAEKVFGVSKSTQEWRNRDFYQTLGELLRPVLLKKTDAAPIDHMVASPEPRRRSLAAESGAVMEEHVATQPGSAVEEPVATQASEPHSRASSTAPSQISSEDPAAV
jgi:hypothetical protein